MSDESLHDERVRNGSEWIKLIVTVLGAIWFVSVVIGLMGWSMGMLGKLSDFGAWFGAISSLFSSLALGGAIYAVLLQREDLELTRKEHKEARIAHQSNAESQGKMVDIQRSTALLENATALSAYYRGELKELRMQKREVSSYMNAMWASGGMPENPDGEVSMEFMMMNVPDSYVAVEMIHSLPAGRFMSLYGKRF